MINCHVKMRIKEEKTKELEVLLLQVGKPAMA
jgi:hypothetical protein